MKRVRTWLVHVDSIPAAVALHLVDGSHAERRWIVIGAQRKLFYFGDPLGEREPLALPSRPAGRTVLGGSAAFVLRWLLHLRALGRWWLMARVFLLRLVMLWMLILVSLINLLRAKVGERHVQAQTYVRMPRGAWSECRVPCI
jgi:hypothetical protein